MELLNINANVIYNIINLLILVVAFRIILFKKVDKILEQRRKDVDGQLQDASDDRIKALILKIPEERLLIETDSPDNRMSMFDHIIALSKLMSIHPSELEDITLRNALSLLP